MIPVDLGLVGGDLGTDGVAFGESVGVAVVELGLGGGDGFGEDRFGVGVEVEQRLEDGVVGGVGGEAAGLAAGGAVAVAAEAGVVAVLLGAAGGGGADVLVAAVGAGDQAGEVVLAVRYGPLGVRVAAGLGDVAGLVERVAVDERFVGVGDVDVAVGDVADVGGVVEDAGNGVAGPGFAGAVAYAALVEFGGDASGADPFLGVEAEDLAQNGCFVVVGDESLAVALDSVAVGASAADPFAFAGLHAHSVDDAVDDGFAFEFGEYAQ